jgi:hypothetical protein
LIFKRLRLTQLVVGILLMSIFIILVNSNNSSEDRYCLVGDDYLVVVSKNQFEAFGKGDYSDFDLDRFAEEQGLEKLYFDDASALKDARIFVSPSPGDSKVAQSS